MNSMVIQNEETQYLL